MFVYIFFFFYPIVIIIVVVVCVYKFALYHNSLDTLTFSFRQLIEGDRLYRIYSTFERFSNICIVVANTYIHIYMYVHKMLLIFITELKRAIMVHLTDLKKSKKNLKK